MMRSAKSHAERALVSSCRRSPARLGAVVAVFVAASVSSLALPNSASAQGAGQDPAPGAGETRTRTCYRGRELPRCGRFWLTEVSHHWRAAGTSYTPPAGQTTLPRLIDLDSHLSWEIGGMVNRSPRHAVGATVMAGTGDAGVRLALKGRYRRWLSEGAALDLSAGPIRTGMRDTTNGYASSAYGLTADAALGIGDYAAVSTRIELVRGRDRTATTVYGGVRLGSYPAVAASVIGGAALIAIIAAIGPT